MDGSRFDHLTRTWGARRSRRAAIALLGGLLATPLLAAGDVEAKKKKKQSLTKPCLR